MGESRHREQFEQFDSLALEMLEHIRPRKCVGRAKPARRAMITCPCLTPWAEQLLVDLRLCVFFVSCKAKIACTHTVRVTLKYACDAELVVGQCDEMNKRETKRTAERQVKTGYPAAVSKFL